jgi:hypothetical protein
LGTPRLFAEMGSRRHDGHRVGAEEKSGQRSAGRRSRGKRLASEGQIRR